MLATEREKGEGGRETCRGPKKKEVEREKKRETESNRNSEKERARKRKGEGEGERECGRAGGRERTAGCWSTKTKIRNEILLMLATGAATELQQTYEYGCLYTYMSICLSVFLYVCILNI